MKYIREVVGEVVMPVGVSVVVGNSIGLSQEALVVDMEIDRVRVV